MLSLNMKAVVRQTGLTADTIRVWEKRYKAITPKRNMAGRREYQAFEVQRLKLLAFLVSAGRRISSIANLRDDELIVQATNLNSTMNLGNKLEQNISDLLSSLKAFDLEKLKLIVRKILFEISPREFVFYLIPTIMIRVEHLSEIGDFSVFQEHALSEIFATLIHEIYEDLSVRKNIQANQKPLIMALPEGEYHEFGLLIAGIVCRLKGFDTIYLGPNLAIESLCEAARNIKPRAILISLTNIPCEKIKMPALKYIEHLNQHIPKSCSIWVGGRRSKELHSLGIKKNLRVFENMLEFEQKIELM